MTEQLKEAAELATSFKQLLVEFTHPELEESSKTYVISFVDLETSDAFMKEWREGVLAHDINRIKALLYKVGVNVEQPIHIGKRQHRPLSVNKIVDDWLVYYYPRDDEWWIKNWASLEQILDMSDLDMRRELKAIRNDVCRADEDGSFKEYVLNVEESSSEL